ncbi:Niemann-Pick type C-2a [Carabus blaptoides fortunei]
MVKQVISLLIAFGIVSFSYGYSDCGSKMGDLVKLTVSSCSNLDKRCVLPRNTNATLTMEFNLKNDVTNVTSVVHGIVLGVPIPFALPNPYGCIDSGLTCPLTAGGPYTYVASLPVEKKYPKVTVDVKWELKDENSNNILCVEIPAKIQ